MNRVFVPFHATLNLYTAYENLDRCFSLSVRLRGSALFLTLRALHVSIALYAPSLVINMVTGIPVWHRRHPLSTPLSEDESGDLDDVIQLCTVIVRIRREDCAF